MCLCDEGAQSSEHLIYDSKLFEFQKNASRHQDFSRLIESIDFNKLQ